MYKSMMLLQSVLTYAGIQDTTKVDTQGKKVGIFTYTVLFSVSLKCDVISILSGLYFTTKTNAY